MRGWGGGCVGGVHVVARDGIVEVEWGGGSRDGCRPVRCREWVGGVGGWCRRWLGCLPGGGTEDGSGNGQTMMEAVEARILGVWVEGVLVEGRRVDGGRWRVVRRREVERGEG